MTEVVDAVGAKAIEDARNALCLLVPEAHIGQHISVSGDDDRVVTHYFACHDPGYVGWRWAVTVARPPRARSVTIDEVVLLPGPDSLLAPSWVPFGERVEPGDLGVGDVLPTPADDERLIPGFADTGDAGEEFALAPSGWEFGIGRARVLSPTGRDAASRRWATGDRGPDSKMAKAATLNCGTCGFLVALAGPLGRSFGVCANEFAPSDGVVVAVDYGCGAHSEIPAATPAVVPVPVLDELGYEDVAPAIAEAAPDVTDLPPDDTSGTHAPPESAIDAPSHTDDTEEPK